MLANDITFQFADIPLFKKFEIMDNPWRITFIVKMFEFGKIAQNEIQSDLSRLVTIVGKWFNVF